MKKFLGILADADLRKSILDEGQLETNRLPEYEESDGTLLLLRNVRSGISLKSFIPDVVAEEVNAPVALFTTPADSHFHQQCALETIHAERAWDEASPFRAAASEANVKVAIVDSGVFEHFGIPDLRISDEDEDEYGHGTHIAGIIGAGEGDGGTVGVVWDVPIHGYRFTDSRGVGTVYHALEKLDQALKEFPNIVVMAWGSPCPSSMLEQRIVDDDGVLFVAAAGNEGDDLSRTKIYPAVIEADNLITVMATACADGNGEETVPAFSSYGDDFVDIAAPGAAAMSSASCVDACDSSPHGILSTVLNEYYCCAKGTSMSAAFVAGAAALVWSGQRTPSPQRVRTCLMESADRLTALHDKCNCGRLNLLRAVDFALRPPSCD